MNIGQILSDTHYTVHPSDSIAFVLNSMSECGLRHLPVVKDGLLMGLVSSESFDGFSGDMQIAQLELTYMSQYLYEDQHIYDAALFFQYHRVDLIPIVDRQQYYLGGVTPVDVMTAMSTAMSLQEPGAIVVLEVGRRDNALSQIARIVESDNAQILHSSVQVLPDLQTLEVTLKINKSDVLSILAAFSSNHYVVKATFNEANNDKDSQDRYDQLMNYINM